MKIQIGYGQIDPSAKPDSAPQSSDIQPWVNLPDLKIDGLQIKNVATCEHNQAILDGTQEHLPDDPQNYPWGFWSSEISGDDGAFPSPPTLDILFSFNHKSPGLTFLFYPHSDDYASFARVVWYDGSGAVVKSGTYQLDGIEAYIQESVPSFRRIKIEFLSTNIRGRYVKLAGINYGQGQSMQDDTIDKAKVLEEVDPTSNEITINTMNFTIRTKDPRFSIVSGVGDDMLMRNQPMTIMADEAEFGTFFLQNWKDVYGNGTVIDFSAIDAIGVMDLYQFWGDVYKNVPIETILEQLFDICFPTRLIRYQIDSLLAGKRVSGWIPTGTCRQALQYICFAIGAAADDSRADYVRIYPPETVLDHVIERGEIYHGPQLQPTTYYSGVDVIAYEYAKGDEEVEAHKATYQAGRKEIRFSEPLHSITVSGGALLDSTANHAIINIQSAGEVIVTGKKYIVNQSVFGEREEVAAGEVENVKIYDNCTMLSPNDAPQIAVGLFRYLKQRAQFDGDVRLEERKVGKVVEIPTAVRGALGNPIQGTIEQLDTNLRAGKARMKVIGSVDNARNRSNS